MLCLFTTIEIQVTTCQRSPLICIGRGVQLYGVLLWGETGKYFCTTWCPQTISRTDPGRREYSFYEYMIYWEKKQYYNFYAYHKINWSS